MIIKMGGKKYRLNKNFFFNVIVILLIIIFAKEVKKENSSLIASAEINEVTKPYNILIQRIEEQAKEIERERKQINQVIEKVHPEIASYKDVFLKNANKEYWQELYSNTHITPEYIVAILMSMAQIESGQGYKDDEFPSSNNTGNGWGLFQIEYLGEPIRSSTIVPEKGIDVQIQTSKDSNDERLNPEKSIEWASAHFYNLLIYFDYDVEMAIQGYNYGAFGVKWLVEDYGNEWINNLDKVTDVIKKRTNKEKENHGDSLYLQKVLALASL